jgi:hypothetical protein
MITKKCIAYPGCFVPLGRELSPGNRFCNRLAGAAGELMVSVKFGSQNARQELTLAAIGQGERLNWQQLDRAGRKKVEYK